MALEQPAGTPVGDETSFDAGDKLFGANAADEIKNFPQTTLVTLFNSLITGKADQTDLDSTNSAITALQTLVASDETSLDDLQEIVDYIQINRADLDALGISGIAGLQAALDTKLATDLSNATVISQAAAETGTDANPAIFSAQRVAQAIAALGGGGSSYSNLFEEDANTLAQRNGINAQESHLYNTYTDAANYSRKFERFSGNDFEVGVEAGGTGVVGNYIINADNVIFNKLRNPLNEWQSVHWSTSELFLSSGNVTIGTSNQLRINFNSLTLNVALVLNDQSAIAETPAATHTLQIKDSSGTTYKVLCVAV